MGAKDVSVKTHTYSKFKCSCHLLLTLDNKYTAGKYGTDGDGSDFAKNSRIRQNKTIRPRADLHRAGNVTSGTNGVCFCILFKNGL